MSDAATATCGSCHRRMRPSPDGLGPKCRAREHPAPPRMAAIKPLPRRRIARSGAPIPGQTELDLEPQEKP